MTDHLGYDKNSKEGDNSGNSRNGDYPKTLKTNLGEITVNVPRDRNGESDPKAVPKHETRLSDEIAEVIIGLYSRGMSTTDIQEQIDQIYGVQVDSSSVSNITNTLLESIKEWQSRPWRKSTSWSGWTAYRLKFGTMARWSIKPSTWL